MAVGGDWLGSPVAPVLRCHLESAQERMAKFGNPAPLIGHIRRVSRDTINISPLALQRRGISLCCLSASTFLRLDHGRYWSRPCDYRLDHGGKFMCEEQLYYQVPLWGVN